MKLYNVRMRASCNGKHVSGAERIIKKENLHDTVVELIKRAEDHENGNFDFLNIVIEKLDPKEIKKAKALPVSTIKTSEVVEGRSCAHFLLKSHQIKEDVIKKAIKLLTEGPSPDKTNMRGAIIMDHKTGDRLEPDSHRGVRVSKIGITKKADEVLTKTLKKKGIFNTTRPKEALILATKVASIEGSIAELCWSDAPNYTTGYVASNRGYFRIENMKERGDGRGGRIFFIDAEKIDIDWYIKKLKEPFIIPEISDVYDPFYFKNISLNELFLK